VVTKTTTLVEMAAWARACNKRRAEAVRDDVQQPMKMPLHWFKFSLLMPLRTPSGRPNKEQKFTRSQSSRNADARRGKLFDFKNQK
jgi:hypothetical protein